MAERYLEINNFRNVGIKKSQKLILGTTLKKENLGGVIYVVGPNNSGKSNCLDALEKFGTNTIAKSDVPDFDDSDPVPELRFVAWEDKATYEQTKSLKSQNNTSGYRFKDIRVKAANQETQEPSQEAKDFGIKVCEFITRNGHQNSFPEPHRTKLLSCKANKIIPNDKGFWDAIISFLLRN